MNNLPIYADVRINVIESRLELIEKTINCLIDDVARIEEKITRMLFNRADPFVTQKDLIIFGLKLKVKEL